MASFSAYLMLVLVSTWTLLPEAHPRPHPPKVKGLSYNFYENTCPSLEKIVRKYLHEVFKKDAGLAPALLRLHFHDCFVQGCDASVLLDGSASGPSEKNAPPNLTLRRKAFEIINQLQALIQKKCHRQTVSCSDILALAARDSVARFGGPSYKVPLGRRDSLEFATKEMTLESLPAPTEKVPALIAAMRKKGMGVRDLVALSGAHTYGIGHCTSFQNRLYPTQDPTMEPCFADGLKQTCPKQNYTNTTCLDITTPLVFDNEYFVNLMNFKGLFTSDQDLYSNSRTAPIVAAFAASQDEFFRQFALSMVEMGKLHVLTGDKGEVRLNCSVRNPDASGGLASAVGEHGQAEA